MTLLSVYHWWCDRIPSFGFNITYLKRKFKSKFVFDMKNILLQGWDEGMD